MESRCRRTKARWFPAPARLAVLAAILSAGLSSCALTGRARRAADLGKIDTIVVIFAENRAFDTLYGTFPGAHGIDEALANPASYTQVDLDGSVLPVLPPVWRAGGDPDAKPQPDPAFPTNLPNRPFRIDAAPIGLGLGAPTRDLVHRYYQSFEQIDGGKNDRFAAVSDAGGLCGNWLVSTSSPTTSSWRRSAARSPTTSG